MVDALLAIIHNARQADILANPNSNGRKKTVGAKRDLLYGTNSSQFLLFVKDIAAVLNKLGLHNMYIVMNNAAIHETPKDLQTICDHGHTTFSYASYSPMLSLIEECWSKSRSSQDASNKERNYG